MPVHEHDCDACVYIASYPLRHPRCLHCWETKHTYGSVVRGWRSEYLVCIDCYNDSDFITMADIYHTCDPGPSFYKFIVRYGKDGEYATTNSPSRYCLVPWVDGVDDFAKCRICGMPDGQCYSLCPNSPAYYTAEQEREDEAWYGMDDNNERYAAERDAMKREGEMP